MKKTALLVIDVQKGFDTEPEYWGSRNNVNAEANMAKLLARWRAANRPVIHVKHNSTSQKSPLRPDQLGNEFKDEVMPQADEPIFEKTVNSAFIGTNLEQHLHEQKIESLVVVGLTTDHCVSTSTRMAANLGFEVTLVSDGTATFERNFNGKHVSAEEMHNIHLASLNDEFCTVKTTAEVLISQ